MNNKTSNYEKPFWFGCLIIIIYILLETLLTNCNVNSPAPDLTGKWKIEYKNKTEIVNIKTSDASLNFDGTVFFGQYANGNTSFDGERNIDNNTDEKLKIWMSGEDNINGSIRIIYLGKTFSNLTFKGTRQ